MGFTGLTKYKDIEIDGYPLIKHHGFIASNRTGALVSSTGAIDWACMPNFDSEPIFASILDKERGGHFSVRPLDTEDLHVFQYYKEFTNILVTEFVRNNRTVLKLTDFIPTSEYPTINFPEIHRYVEATTGDVDVRVEFFPILDYGKNRFELHREKGGYLFRSPKKNVAIVGEVNLKKSGVGVTGDFTIPERSSKWIVMLHNVSHIDRITDYKSYNRMEETSAYWKNWVSQGNYQGIYSENVIRSALALKGLFFEPSGLMVAAPTTSLPECIGGERNWDYRYAWIRDTAYVIEALSLIGYKREATKFLYDMMERIQLDGRIRTIYTISEDGDTNEVEVDFSGYRDSKPVRIGNKASEQLQIDEYGTIINAIYYFSKIGGLINSYLWDFLLNMLQTLKSLWKEKDSSLWEFRTAPEHYVYSKLLCWTAFTRAIEIAENLHFSAPFEEWKKTADEIKKSILTYGYNKEINSLTQYYGTTEIDASLLRAPSLGFLPASDRRMKGTVQRIEEELMDRDYLFKRYKADDGLKGNDNAFLLLSFWYVEDLILFKNTKKARTVFETLLEKGNHLGLFPEEIGFDSGEMLGNFPQGITHLGIIRAAKKLSDDYKQNLKRNVSKHNY